MKPRVVRTPKLEVEQSPVPDDDTQVFPSGISTETTESSELNESVEYTEASKNWIEQKPMEMSVQTGYVKPEATHRSSEEPVRRVTNSHIGGTVIITTQYEFLPKT